MRPSAASFVIIAAGIAMLPTAAHHNPVAVAGEAAGPGAAPASSSVPAKSPPANASSPALAPETRVAPPTADFSSDERANAAVLPGAAHLSRPGDPAPAPSTAPTIPAAPAPSAAPASSVTRVITHVSTVYTMNLPAGFVQTVREMKTNLERGQTVTTINITQYRRPYEPLPASWIEIPFLNLRARLLEGVSQRVMARAPGHFPGTALPGDIGNCAIAAHSNVPGCAYFRSLHRLRPGDEIFLYRGGKQYRYIVTGLHVVSPHNVSDLLPTNYRRLTLVTCALPDARKRLIVTAEGPGGELDDAAGQVIASRRTLPAAGRTRPRHTHRSRHH